MRECPPASPFPACPVVQPHPFPVPKLPIPRPHNAAIAPTSGPQLHEPESEGAVAPDIRAAHCDGSRHPNPPRAARRPGGCSLCGHGPPCPVALCTSVPGERTRRASLVGAWRPATDHSTERRERRLHVGALSCFFHSSRCWLRLTRPCRSALSAGPDTWQLPSRNHQRQYHPRPCVPVLEGAAPAGACIDQRARQSAAPHALSGCRARWNDDVGASCYAAPCPVSCTMIRRARSCSLTADDSCLSMWSAGAGVPKFSFAGAPCKGGHCCLGAGR